MFTLDISDLRTTDELRRQANHFKAELVEMLDDFRFNLDNIEKEVLSFVKRNRIHYPSDLKHHQKEMELEFPVSDDRYTLSMMEKKLVEHSVKYPFLLFKLTYKPANPYESLVLYFKEGRIQRCPTKIVVEDFDEKKLRDIT